MTPRLTGTAIHAAFASVVISFCSLPAGAQDKAQVALGKKLFADVANTCMVCHTLKDAEAEGQVGPSLDEIKPNAQRVATALRNGIGQMPSYKGRLDEAQIAALAAYVASATTAGK